MNWKEIAPKRADWEILRKIFIEAGLPPCSFVNGEPKWSAPVDQTLVEKIAQGYKPNREIPTAGLTNEPTASPSPQAQPKKRGRGRPRKNK